MQLSNTKHCKRIGFSIEPFPLQISVHREIKRLSEDWLTPSEIGVKL
jgi:hypothetical protein